MRHFTYKTLNELQQETEKLGTRHVHFEEDSRKIQTILARPVAMGKLRAGNSIAIHPMEGCDGTSDGAPDELTFRRYERFGRGGAKLIWFEATAVREDGRANTRQLWIHEKTLPEIARLLERTLAVHKEIYGTADDVVAPLQLTHSGRYSVPKKILGYRSPSVDARFGMPGDYPVISDDELERLEDWYVDAARLALRAGFRAVDVKATHGYLLFELLGAKHRAGRYGGSLENRTRFIKNVFGKIRAALGNQMSLCMRLGCYEGVPFVLDPQTGTGVPVPYTTPYPHGFGNDEQDPMKEDLSEVKQAIGWFREWGLELLNVSLGSPYFNPHMGRPFEKPDDGNYESPEHPLIGVDRHFRIAGELQRAFPDLPMVGTGYSWLQTYALNAAAHNVESGAITFYGAGRNALAYPDFARDALEKGVMDGKQVCRTVTFCTYLMRQKHNDLGQYPTGCPPYDKEVYGPIIKLARQTKR
ncbi:MAG: NADH:flavin oxidoreductase [Candidatus Solibacter usitatus]|nr:NADH:flavin oxidoreductase [Candidatus Solibacter usitatus]